MKAAIALSLLGCVFGFSGKAFAGDAWGPCTPVDGTTYHYNVDVDVGASRCKVKTSQGRF